jgi:hypothetical protein
MIQQELMTTKEVAAYLRIKERKVGSFQIPVDSFSEPLAVIGWQLQP